MRSFKNVEVNGQPSFQAGPLGRVSALDETAAMWMSSQQPANALNSPMTLFPYLPKRDSLLYVAQPLAVTLTCDAPSRALCPGISVSSGEPSGVFVSWYCLSSSRSLGHSLLLGQRSRLNRLSDLIRSLLHQHYRCPDAELMSHRDN